MIFVLQCRGSLPVAAGHADELQQTAATLAKEAIDRPMKVTEQD